MALLSKALPKFLFNRALYKMTGRKALVLTSMALIFGVTLWLSPTTADDRPPGVPDEARWVKVDRITDGDTIVLMDRTRVRLHGIDAPERDQPYGKQATRNLDKLIGRTVFVVERDTDRYGRLVAILYTPEGVNVNLEMVCNGSAWWHSRYAKNNRAMADCQDEAKEAGLGLWAGDDPVASWEWRRR